MNYIIAETEEHEDNIDTAISNQHFPIEDSILIKLKVIELREELKKRNQVEINQVYLID